MEAALKSLWSLLFSNLNSRSSFSLSNGWSYHFPLDFSEGWLITPYWRALTRHWQVPCCVPCGSLQHTCCRAVVLIKSRGHVFSWTRDCPWRITSPGVQISLGFSGEKEEFTHNQSLVSAGQWQISVRKKDQLQGPLLREGKGNLVRKASESQLLPISLLHWLRECFKDS